MMSIPRPALVGASAISEGPGFASLLGAPSRPVRLVDPSRISPKSEDQRDRCLNAIEFAEDLIGGVHDQVTETLAAGRPPTAIEAGGMRSRLKQAEELLKEVLDLCGDVLTIPEMDHARGLQRALGELTEDINQSLQQTREEWKTILNRLSVIGAGVVALFEGLRQLMMFDPSPGPI